MKIDSATRTVLWLMTITLMTAPLLVDAATDFGDLPAPYKTLLIDDGPRHEDIGPRFGSRDTEDDGQPNSAATGDDTAGIDDENSVYFQPTQNFPGPITAGRLSEITIYAYGADDGFLNAWIDFNHDFDFDDPGEQIFTDRVIPSVFTYHLLFEVPIDAATDVPLGARFRLSSTAGLGPTGAASDGEVEDYLVTIAAPRPCTEDVFLYDFGGATGSETTYGGIAVHPNATIGEIGRGFPVDASSPNPPAETFWFNGRSPVCARLDDNGVPIITWLPTGPDGWFEIDLTPVGLAANQFLRITEVGFTLCGVIPPPTATWVELPDPHFEVRSSADGFTEVIARGYAEAAGPNTCINFVGEFVPGVEIDATTTYQLQMYQIKKRVLFPNLTTVEQCSPPVYDSYENGLDNFRFYGCVGTLPLSLGDRVWYDTDQDGIQGQGEPGVPDVSVALFGNGECTGNPVATTSTDGSGLYEFADLMPGTYCLLFGGIPSGWHLSPKQVGADPAVDSDADPDGRITTIELSADDDTRDVGVFASGTIGNTVWCDENTNGVFDPSEGVDGVTVDLFADVDCDQMPDGAPIASRQTAGDGQYLFEDVVIYPPGALSCYLAVVDESGLGDCSFPFASNGNVVILDPENPIDLEKDFGYIRQATDIPTLSSGGLVVLIVLMALLGVVVVRRQL